LANPLYLKGIKGLGTFSLGERREEREERMRLDPAIAAGIWISGSSPKMTEGTLGIETIQKPTAFP